MVKYERKYNEQTAREQMLVFKDYSGFYTAMKSTGYQVKLDHLNSIRKIWTSA